MSKSPSLLISPWTSLAHLHSPNEIIPPKSSLGVNLVFHSNSTPLWRASWPLIADLVATPLIVTLGDSKPLSTHLVKYPLSLAENLFDLNPYPNSIDLAFSFSNGSTTTFW